MRFLGIDPGVGGGIAWVDALGVVQVEPMPKTETDLRDLLEPLIPTQGDVTCFIEELPRFAGKMSGSSMATMFQSYGTIRGILVAHRVRLIAMPPKKWQAHHGLGTKATHGDRWKAHLKGKAQNLFPHLKLTLKTADAVLILDAGRNLSTKTK
jgi:hypothetical protein